MSVFPPNRFSLETTPLGGSSAIEVVGGGCFLETPTPPEPRRFFIPESVIIREEEVGLEVRLGAAAVGSC